MDQAVLKSDKKIKQFLESQSIAFESGASPEVLRGKAKARMKRIAEEGVDDGTKRKLFNHGPTKICSITELQDMVAISRMVPSTLMPTTTSSAQLRISMAFLYLQRAGTRSILDSARAMLSMASAICTTL